MPTSAQIPTPSGEPLPVRLVNTLRAERGRLHDDLQTPTAILDWLRANGFATRAVDRAGSSDTTNLRAALRTVAAHLTTDRAGVGRRPGDAPVGDLEEALALVTRHADAAPRGRLTVVDDHVRWVTPPPGRTVDDALAAIALAATALFAGPDVAQLRACHGPRCVLYFVQDHPRREWCSPACGNRARAARHYRRRSGAALEA